MESRMLCPVCHTESQPGQKFCGSCGHKMETDCSQCGASNPPAHRFCTRCGHNLGSAGTIALVRSGLIAEVDSKACALLGHLSEEMTGKPFSWLVAREDLALFFSHWNALLESREKQVLELAMNHKKGRPVYALVECTFEEQSATQVPLIHLNLSDITNRRQSLDRLQHQQDLLHLIYALADEVRTVSGAHLDAAISDALKKICLFTRSDRCFIFMINRQARRLEPSHQWGQPSRSGGSAKSRGVSLSMLKRCIIRLRRERAYIVGDVAKLPPAERYELLAWHQTDLGAIMCHLIYDCKRPIGIIGVAQYRGGTQWSPDCMALVRLFGQMVSNLLPQAATAPIRLQGRGRPRPVRAEAKRIGAGNGAGSSSPAAHATASPAIGHEYPSDPESLEQKSQPIPPRPLPETGRPMLLEKHPAGQTRDQRTVLARDDGLVLLTCPHCGGQESVPTGEFEKLGNAVKVLCTCRKHFSAVLEKRRAYRKSVQLEGFFTIAGEYGPNDTKGSIWGPMVVRNISKTGLQFHSKRIDLIRPGDQLMVRFNLDNSNRALIHKQVQVVSIHDQLVGCRFKGADQYDITLGFYFM
jgi:PAS domain S-box-containing protein